MRYPWVLAWGMDFEMCHSASAGGESRTANLEYRVAFSLGFFTENVELALRLTRPRGVSSKSLVGPSSCSRRGLAEGKGAGSRRWCQKPPCKNDVARALRPCAPFLIAGVAAENCALLSWIVRFYLGLFARVLHYS